MTNITARPTLYKGVPMRSRLEATVAGALDAINAAWTYEPCALADNEGQYLPDFLLRGIAVARLDDTDRVIEQEDQEVFVEVRPTSEKAREKCARESRIVRANSTNPLIYVGMHRLPLLGGSYSDDKTEWAAIVAPRDEPVVILGLLAALYFVGARDALGDWP